MKKIFAICLLLLITACQSASTYSPKISKDELANEQAMQRQIARASANKPKAKKIANYDDLSFRVWNISNRLLPASRSICEESPYRNNNGCIFPVELGKERGLNAYADGEKVVVFPEMVMFTQTDDELAYIIAHELAHNIMGHVNSTKSNATVGGLIGGVVDMLAQSQGLNTGGGFTKLGAQSAVSAYSKDFEREADYIGMYIVARAGYDEKPAPDLWRRMSAEDPNGIYSGSSHPTNPERFVAMRKIITEIETKRAAGQPIAPFYKNKKGN
jgi:predicted Zn-dependent protease